jgi:fatty acid desaturase
MLVESPPDKVAAGAAAGQARGLAGEAHDIIALSPRLAAYNIGYLALVWAVALGAVVVAAIHPAWYTIVPAIVLVSSRHQALLNIEHEALHGKLLPNRRWNNLVGRWLCAAVVGSPYEATRARHLTHHRLVGTHDDPDRDLHSGPEKRTRAGLAKHFVGGLLGGYAGMVLMGPPRRDSGPASPGSRARDATSIAVAQLVLAAGFTLAFDWWVYPTLWLAPLVTVTVLGHLIRSFVEHAIAEEEVPGHSNRLITIRSNLIERFMVAPYSMNYHAEHHLLPSVPAPRLKELHERLAERDDRPPVLVRRSYGDALRRYVRSLPDDS